MRNGIYSQEPVRTMPRANVPKTVGTAPPFIADIPKRGQNIQPSHVYKPRFFTEYLLSHARRRRSAIGGYVPTHEVSVGGQTPSARPKKTTRQRKIEEWSGAL